MDITVTELYNQIDEFLAKAEKKYFDPKKGQKPPKGVQIKVGPKQGKYYLTEERAPTQQVDENTLRRQYAAYKTKLKGKLTPQEQDFVNSTLGELNKLNPDELIQYFRVQYSLKNKKAGEVNKKAFERNLKMYGTKINIEKNLDTNKVPEIFKWLIKSTEVDKTHDYALIYKTVTELIHKFHVENTYIFKIRNWVFDGVKNLLNKGDSQLLDYAAGRIKYYFSGMDPKDKNEAARFLMGNVYSEGILLDSFSYFKKYEKESKSLYDLFILALKPIKENTSDYKYQVPIYNAFIKRDWDKAELLTKSTRYGILR